MSNSCTEEVAAPRVSPAACHRIVIRAICGPSHEPSAMRFSDRFRHFFDAFTRPTGAALNRNTNDLDRAFTD